MTTLLLIHGGLWEDMDAERFWRRPGIAGGLERRGFTVIAPDRIRRAPSWEADADHIASFLPADPVTVVAASFGCSAAARLALSRPDTVARLLLAWPASLRDPAVHAATRDRLAGLGATQAVIEALTGSGTLSCATDAELASLRPPVGVLPPVTDNPYHRAATTDALLRLLPSAVALPACPEPPRPEFPPHLETLLEAITLFAG